MSRNTLAQLIAFTPEGAALTRKEEGFIARNHIGAFVLFARNIPELEAAKRLIARLHSLAQNPLIAVDQEGGRVIRLPTPATHFPSAMAIGATDAPELAYRAGQATARELRALNLNAVLAPVLDVNNNPANPVIGTRAFGDTPQRVSKMGIAWLRGAQSEGVAACAKHFPGHGDTRVDSHEALPRIEHAREDLERTELAPFRAAVRAGVDMVMPGHLLMPTLDPERPASLSPVIIDGLLRGEMQYDGVVITDALDMQAVALKYGIAGSAVEAARAGCDLLCCITEFEGTLAALEQAWDDGRLARDQVERSVERVRRLRSRPMPGAADPAWLGAGEHRALAAEIAQAGLRVEDRDGLLPLGERAGVFICEFALGLATIAEGASAGTGKLLARLRESAPGLDGAALPFDPDEHARREALTQAGQAGTLVIATRQAVRFPAQQRLVRELLATRKRAALVAMRDPYDLALFPEARCTLAAFDDSPAMLDAVAHRLLSTGR